MTAIIDVQKVPEVHSLGYKAYQRAIMFLLQEQLVRSHQDNFQFLSITHKGIRALEGVFRNVTESTEYFPSYREMMR